MSTTHLSRRIRTSRAVALLATAALGAGTLAACGGDSGSVEASGDGPTVVASTSVYADIVEQVAGPNVTVETVISDPAADPHSYEASPADAARVARADLLVYNGGGYDAFVDLALDSAPELPAVRGVDEFANATGRAAPEHSHDDEGHEGEGHDHDHDADADAHREADDETDGHAHDAAANEHVWFSLPTAAAVAERVAEELSQLDPEHASDYQANAQTFRDALVPLEAQLDEIADRGHFPYAQTERIGAHLFDAAHLDDLTPRGFLSSVEDDTDPAAADLAAMLTLLDERRVDFLAYNSQTETAVTSRVRDAAEKADVVVVDLTETLPDGVDYLTWMRAIVEDLASALAGATPGDHGDH